MNRLIVSDNYIKLRCDLLISFFNNIEDSYKDIVGQLNNFQLPSVSQQSKSKLCFLMYQMLI
jgi:ribosome biogenesis protein Nip4